MATSIAVNGMTHSVEADGDTPLLYVLRNDLALNGAKYGCGFAQCGACTVVVDGRAVRSCVTPLATLTGKSITTIEGLGAGGAAHPLQKAFVAEQAAQCGYCANGGRPVKLQWMREDEFGWEPYGSAMVMKLQARLDARGRVVDWQHETWSHPRSTRPGGAGGNLLAGWYLADPVQMGFPVNGAQPAGAADRNAVPLDAFPNQRILLHYLPEMPLRTSALRTLGAYANVFALESFIDELAAAANVDAVEFRLRHLQDPRARAVIEAAASRAGWQSGRKGDGTHGCGIAFAKYKNLAAYVAVVADVEIDRHTGNVRVAKAVAAVDAGLVINPDGLTNQIEGGIIQSTSWSLKESVRYDAQRLQTRSWADYAILTFPEVPAVEIVLLNRPDKKPLGAGEGSQGPTVAAIANATGTRMRDLPFTRERVKAALA